MLSNIENDPAITGGLLVAGHDWRLYDAGHGVPQGADEMMAACRNVGALHWSQGR